DGLERKPVDIRDRVDLTVGVQVVVVWPDLDVAGRKYQVRLVDLANDVHDAELVRLQLERVYIDHDLAVLAAERLRHRGAGDICDLVADVVLPQVTQLRLV